jgi:hypothetical protein
MGPPALPIYCSSSWNISVAESAHIAAVLDVFEVSTASTQRQKAWVFNLIKPGLITSPVTSFAGFFIVLFFGLVSASPRFLYLVIVPPVLAGSSVGIYSR